MPTYAYECSACGHKLEAFQTMTARPLRKCPECKASKLQRLIGPGAGFIFKGSGFYITDYRKPQGGGDQDAPKAPDTKKETGKAPAGDSAPGTPKSDAAPAKPAKPSPPKGDKVA